MKRTLLWGGAFCGVLAIWGSSVATAQSQVSESALPSDGRDAAERIIFRFEGRYDTTSNQLTGEGAPQGEVYDEGALRTGANYALGDLRLGTRRVLLPTLNTYGLLSGGFDIDGQPNIQAAEGAPVVGASEHRYLQQAYGDTALFLHSAYAELDGFTRGPVGRNFSLRAGRQFHWGVGAATFDGATVGYEDGVINANVRFGQRSGVYNLTQNDLGLVGGADVVYDFEPGQGVPLIVKGEYVFFSREVNLTQRDALSLNGDIELDTERVTVNLGELSAYLDASDDVLVTARFKITDTALSRAMLGLRWVLGDAAVLLLDLHQKIGEDVFYDLSGGKGLTVTNPTTGLDRRTTYEVYRLNIPDLQPFTDIQARLPWALTDWLSLQPEAGARLSLGDAETLSPYDASYVNWGLGAFARTRISDRAGLEVDLSYNGRVYDRGNVFTGRDAQGLFTDVASGPETSSHEVQAGVAYHRGRRFLGGRMLGDRSLTLGTGLFYKAYTLSSRRLNVGGESVTNDEALVGANAHAKWWATQYTNFGLRYEYAKDSNVFFSHLAEFHTVQGRFVTQF